MGIFLKQRYKRYPFLFYLLLLVLMTSLLKLLFYFYNYNILLKGQPHSILKIGTWSLINDIFVVLIINLPFLFLLILTRRIWPKITSFIIRITFWLLNSLMILLNTIDIFYFRFQFQRSNLDLLYVIDHPLQKLAQVNFWYILAAAFILILIFWLVLTLQNHLFHSLRASRRYNYVFILTGSFLTLLIIFRFPVSSKLVPTYPLSELNIHELSAVQNSMHTFIYSLYRNNHRLLDKNYFPRSYTDTAMSVRKVFSSGGSVKPPNIILFIMESIPADFFEPGNTFKTRTPFFDSLMRHSTFFTNAYSYGRESNKGITSILAGIPVLTDIPIYHSSFYNAPKTGIGTALKSKGYTSMFFIGDTYDNFGFAKCVYWLGFDHYYCDRDMPDYKNLPRGPMGIFDQYVMQFMQHRIDQTHEPFFAVNYNTTTHYDHSLPDDYRPQFAENKTRAMKSFEYYDDCLRRFFYQAQEKEWFQNTTFIFCSDHWGSPDDYNTPVNNLAEFRIPVLIYSPARNRPEKNNALVSQFDILGTVLNLAGYSDTAISYGNDLLSHNPSSEEIITRVNSYLYQTIDTAYVLGFNTEQNRPEYLYHYRHDPSLKKDLKNDPKYEKIKNRLKNKFMLFYQKTLNEYFKSQSEAN